jgi:hypothetical protein
MLVRDILYASPQIFSDEGLKKYRMVFRAGLRDPCTRDVARLSEIVEILEPQSSVFLRIPKVEQLPKCMDHAIQCLENHLVIVL